MEKPFGSLDPNSQHQVWSRWIFTIDAAAKRPTPRAVANNAQRYFVKLFASSVGRVRCDSQGARYVVIAEIEGPPAHDPEYRSRVQVDFERIFIGRGFGVGARLVNFTVGMLAGDQQDGQPPAQMLVMPRADFTTQLHGV